MPEPSANGTMRRIETAAAPDAVLVVRLLRGDRGAPIDAVIEFANRAWRTVVGLGDAEVVGRRLLEVMPAFAERIAVLARAIDTGETVDVLEPMPGDASRRVVVQVTPDGERACVVVHEVTRELDLEDRLLAYERRLTVALDAIPGAFVLYRPVLDERGAFVDAEVLQVNRFARDRWLGGVSPGEVRGMRLFAAHPELRPAIFDIYRSVVETGRPWQGVRRVDSPAGEVWLDLLVARTADGFLHTSRDVTARHHAEEALRASEERYRLLADNAADIVFLGDPDATFRWVSPSIRTALGWDPEALVGTSALALVDPEHRARVQQAWSQELAEDAEVRFEARYRHADGTSRWFSVRGRPVRDAAGRVIGHSGIGRDIQAEMEARDALAASEARYRGVVASLAEGVIVCDRDGQVVEVNDRALEIAGLPPTATLEEFGLAQRAVGADMRRADGTAVARQDAPGLVALRTGATVAARELLSTGPDGRRSWYRVGARPLLDAAGAITGSVTTFSDTTAERDARAAIELQARLIDLAHDAILVRAMDGTIRSWNAGARALYGWTAEEAVGQVSHELLRTTFPAALAAIQDEVDATDTWEGRLRHVTRDGRRVIVESRWVAIHDDGPGGAVMEINRDITGMVEAVEALEWSQAELAEAERLAITGSWRLDTRTGAPSWSQGMYRIFGLDPSAGIPARDRLAEFVGAEVADRLGALFARLVATGEPYTTDLEVRRPDRSTLRVEAHGEIVRDASGAPIAVRGAVVDITELHRAREAAELAHRELAEAQRLAHVGSWRWDPAADTFEWSDELFRICGLEPGRPAPTRAEQAALYSPAELGRFIAALEQGLPDGEPYSTELDLTRPDGTRRRVLVRAGTIRDADGRVRMVRGSVADITDVQAAELLLRRFNDVLEEQVAQRTTQLEAANEELRTFSHAISHDLRGPVRAIASFAGLVLRSAGDRLDETDRHRMDNIVQSGITMGRLIDDLAAYTRLGRGGVQAIPVPLGPLVATLRVLLAARLLETGGEIQLAGEDVVPLADPSLLERTLLNLADNGLAYSRPGVPPVVRITAEPRGEHVVVSVADNGVGIAHDLQERVFELFTRTRADQQLEHSGVGLAVARKAARAMGTDLELTSEVGAGSTFRLALPRG